MSNLGRKKNDLKPFLWGFRDYFMMRYPRIEDEVILKYKNMNYLKIPVISMRYNLEINSTYII